jgi:hypothetical protein
MANKNSVDSSTYKMCYQKALPATTGGVITFSKGVFHPHSGWIPHTSSKYQLHADRSSVLKFNPGARESFSFIGPALQSLNCGNIDIEKDTLQSRSFSSKITLSMAKDIQWDPECYCEEERPGGGTDTPHYNANQKNKEYADIDPNRSNHGYRYLAGGTPKRPELTASQNSFIENDEFSTSQNGNNFSYAFAVTGPVARPEQKTLPDGKIQLRVPNVENFGIKNIEVKLNFLNYVNTKNIIVKLSISSPSITDAIPPGGEDDGPVKLPPSPLRLDQNAFLDQTVPPKTTFGAYRNNPRISDGINNSAIASYLQSLMKLNSGSGIGQPDDIPGPQNEIVLLNQETIQNNGYNFSIKFSLAFFGRLLYFISSVQSLLKTHFLFLGAFFLDLYLFLK